MLGISVLALAVLGGASTFGFTPFQWSQADRSQPALLTSIEDISQYHAAVGNFQVVFEIEEDAAWAPQFIAGRKTLIVAPGTVNAYIDLSGLDDKDLVLSPDGKSATVRLPEPQLDKPNLNPEGFVMYQDRGIFDRVIDALETPQQAEFYQLAETKMAAAAEESELREQATENIKAMLTGMFGSHGIHVTFLHDAPS